MVQKTESAVFDQYNIISKLKKIKLLIVHSSMVSMDFSLIYHCSGLTHVKLQR